MICCFIFIPFLEWIKQVGNCLMPCCFQLNSPLSSQMVTFFFFQNWDLFSPFLIPKKSTPGNINFYWMTLNHWSDREFWVWCEIGERWKDWKKRNYEYGFCFEETKLLNAKKRIKKFLSNGKCLLLPKSICQNFQIDFVIMSKWFNWY